MSFNIMEAITEQINPENIKAVAGMLGEDEGAVGKAISGVAPALLGGLVKSFSKPEGKQAFEQQLEQADDGIMDNIAGLLGGGGGSDLVTTGTKMIGSLFGDDKMGLLASAISSFSGLSGGSTKSLLGLAGPMLMGMLKKKGKSDGLDVGGLVGMLMGQKDNIAKAMPAGLGDSLSGMGLLDDGLDKAADTAASAAAAGKEVADSGKSLFSRLLPIIVLAVLGWLAYQFLMKPASDPVQQGSTMGAVQPADQLESLMSETGKVLAGVDSAESAKRALNRLQSVDQGLAKLVDAASGMSSTQSAQLAQRFGQLAPELERSLAKAYDVPGARDVLSGTVDSILSKLKTISGS